MGNNQQSNHTLVVMVTKDVFHIDYIASLELLRAIEGDDKTFSFVDTKTAADVTVQISNVVSIISGGQK